MATYTISGSNAVTFDSYYGTETTGTYRVGRDGNFNSIMTCRYKFTTDANGASSVSFSTARAVYNYAGTSSPNAPSAIRWDITTSSTKYKTSSSTTAGYTYSSVKGAQDTWEDQTSYYKGSANIKLMPNTTYYLWFWPGAFPGYTSVYLGKVTLTTSGAYGTASTIAASNGTFGSGIPITLTNSVSGVTNTLTVSCGGITQTLLNNSSATSVTWTPALATYGPAITNSKTATATFTTTTKYGTATWGTSTKSITVTFPSNAGPSVDMENTVLSPNNLPQASLIPNYIQNHSRVQAVISASAQYNASISVYSLSVNNATEISGSSPIQTSGIISSSGNIPITISVTDSRGFTASTNTTIYVYEYAAPYLIIEDGWVFRCNENRQPDEAGEFISVRAVGNVSDLGSNGITPYNVPSLGVNYKSTDTDFSQNDIVLENNTPLRIPKLDVDHLDGDKTYIVRITVTDSLGQTSSITYTISAQNWAIKFAVENEKVSACGIGKAPEVRKTLEIPHDWEISRLNQNGTETHYVLFDDDLSFKTYTDVSQLGLTAGSATLADIWTALSENSILIADALQLASAQVPNTNGTIEIVKTNANGSQGWIEFRGYEISDGDYRMGITSNAPSGVWVQVYVGALPIPIADGGTGATTAATARANLGIDAQSHAATTFSDKNLSDVTNTTMASLTLPAGTFVLFGYISFASNTTGYRSAWVSNSNTSGVATSAVTVGGAVGADTRINCLWIASSTSSTTWYLRARQYSGTTLKCSGGLRAFRVSF